MAIMFDESTDCTITEQLVILCRYIIKDTGVLQPYFLKVIDVLGQSKSDNADGEGDTQRVISLSTNAITSHICN